MNQMTHPVGRLKSEPSTVTPCLVCGKLFPPDELTPAEVIRPRVARLVRRDHPQWSDRANICLPDLNRYRVEYVRQVLEAESGELSVLETDVVESLKEHEILARNIHKEFETQRTWGQRCADVLTGFGGSWKFILLFFFFMSSWILVNVAVFRQAPDPYPFILLNLLLSCLAALQAPIIMMSQNRQAARDRLCAETDYKVNLKAELEIRHLHEKLDHLLRKQSQRFFEIQQIQLELMRDLTSQHASQQVFRTNVGFHKSGS